MIWTTGRARIWWVESIGRRAYYADSRVLGTDKIENETGEFQVFGPTSSLRHLVSLRQNERTRPLGHEPVRQHIKTDQGGIVVSGQTPERATTTPAKHQYEATEFRRYLPRDVQISRLEHDKALDSFFRYHASWGEFFQGLTTCRRPQR